MTVNETGIVLKLEGFSHKLPVSFESLLVVSPLTLTNHLQSGFPVRLFYSSS